MVSWFMDRHQEWKFGGLEYHATFGSRPLAGACGPRKRSTCLSSPCSRIWIIHGVCEKLCEITWKNARTRAWEMRNLSTANYERYFSRSLPLLPIRRIYPHKRSEQSLSDKSSQLRERKIEGLDLTTSISAPAEEQWPRPRSHWYRAALMVLFLLLN